MLSPAPGNSDMIANQRSNPLPFAAVLIGLTVMSVVALPLLLAGAAVSDRPASGLAAGAVCSTSGPIAGLSDVAAANARTIAAVAFARDGDRAALIVLMVGLAESGLRQLGNTNDAESIALPNQGVGSDHDSVGIFQQRASWGSVQQRMDPATSTGLLLDRLERVGDWRTREPWLAAQTVQVSAFGGVPRPENGFSREVGANYRAALPEATRLLTIIKRDSNRQRCEEPGGSGVGVPPAGPTGPYGLPIAFTLPADTSLAGRTAVLATLDVLGRPYVFGATGPDAFDCSGLTTWAWAKAGGTLPHYTVSQWQAGAATDAAHLAPGDLALTPGSDGTLADPQHVGMFIGNGLVVEAPQTGDVVKVITYESFVSAGLSGPRHIG
jgi:cell wall-associated NlpC family hydrolase